MISSCESMMYYSCNESLLKSFFLTDHLIMMLMLCLGLGFLGLVDIFFMVLDHSFVCLVDEKNRRDG